MHLFTIQLLPYPGTEDIDVVLIPLIVFDENGHRIGYGKGYYDRFLESCRPDTLKVGLSILPPIKEIPEVEAHDIPMDYCIGIDQVL